MASKGFKPKDLFVTAAMFSILTIISSGPDSRDIKNTCPVGVRPSLASGLPEVSVPMCYALHLLSPTMQVDKG